MPDEKAVENTESDNEESSETSTILSSKQEDPATDTSKEDLAKTEEPKAPETYDLVVPEGVTLPEGKLDEIASYAKERGLSQEVAQDLVARDVAAVAAHEQYLQQNMETKSAEWTKELKDDPEFGGANFEVNCNKAQAAVTRLATPELREFLRGPVGNMPAVVKFFKRLNDVIAEDTILTQQVKVKPQPKSAADRFYSKVKE